jgi:hypothetical protein
MSNEKLNLNFPVLSGKSNYVMWAKKVLLVIKGAGARHLIGSNADSNPRLSPVVSTDRDLDDRVHAALCLSVSDDLFSFVDGTETTHDAWYALKSRLSSSGLQESMLALKLLFRIDQGSDSVKAYIARIEEASNLVKTIAAKHLTISDSLKAMIILMGVSDSLQHVVDSIDASTNGEVTSESIISILLRHEARNPSTNRVNQEITALKAEISKMRSRPKPNFCNFCDCPKTDCYRDKCFNLHPELRPSPRKVKFTTSDKQESVSVYSASSTSPISSGCDCWLIDCGCNNHITNSACSLSQVRSSNLGVLLGDNSVIQSGVGIGQRFISFGNSTGTMNDVLHVPSMGKNLLSVGVSTSRGLSFWFDDDTCTIFQSISKAPVGEVLCKVSKKNGLYSVPCEDCNRSTESSSNLGTVSPQANFAKKSSKADATIWHQRLGHSSERYFNLLTDCYSEGIQLTNESNCKGKVCEPCIQAKITRGMFSDRDPSSISTKPLQLVFSDIKGPLPPAFSSQSKYFITFIDDCTRYSMVYFLRKKSDALGKLKEYIAEARRRFAIVDIDLISFQTDGGGEYCSNDAHLFYSSSGINHRITVPYSPESNGIAERLNRSIMEAAEAMMINAKLPDEFWADAVNTSVYLLNRRYHRTIQMTPFQLWHGKQPNLSHLKVFGCNAWRRVADHNRVGLDPKANRCVFLGYAGRQLGYRIWDIVTKKFGVTRDVIFDESRFDFNKCLYYSSSSSTSSTSPSESIISILLRREASNELASENSSHTEEVDSGIETLEDPSTQNNHIEDVPELLNGIELDSMSSSSPASLTLPSDSSSEDGPNRGALIPTHRYPGRIRMRPSRPGMVDTTCNVRSRSTSPDEGSLVVNSVLVCNVELNNQIQNIGTNAEYLDTSIIQTLLLQRMIALDELRDEPSLPTTQYICNKVSLNEQPPLTNVFASGVAIPTTFAGAVNDPVYGSNWLEAARKEMESIRSRSTYIVMALPTDRKAIDCKWVFAVKADANGCIEKFKARLVVKGFSQRPGLDYDETFAPVAHNDTQRLIMALAVNNGLRLRQADILSAFLCGDIDFEIYMKQPEGFMDRSHPDHVCKLEKGLYGLKQAGHLFNQKLNAYLTNELKFTRCNCDPCLYYINEGGDFILLSLHVDDMLFAHNCEEKVEHIMKRLHDTFGIKDLGSPVKLLGIRVRHDFSAHSVSLDQEVYVDELLSRFNMVHSKEVCTPHQPGVYLTEDMCPSSQSDKFVMADIPYAELVGGLNFLATRTRPDISYIVSQLCRFMHNPGLAHWRAAKRVLRYLKGTKSLGLMYYGRDDVKGATDSDWAGDPDQRRSTSGFVFKLSNGPVSWKSQRQRSTALSALEAEYMAQCSAARQAAWLHQLLSETTARGGPIILYGDNQGSQAVAKNRKTDAKTKHIQVQYHFTRDKVEDKTIQLQYCQTDLMIADYLTKPVSAVKFKWCRTAIGMVDVALRGCVETSTSP